MASAWLPSWVHAPSWAVRCWDDLRSIWGKEMTLGTAVLAGIGLGAATLLAQDLYENYWKPPLYQRGTQSRSPTLYIRSLLVRFIHWVRGDDGTSSAPIREFVRRQSEQIYGRRFLTEADVPKRREPRPQLLHLGLPHRHVPQMVDPELQEKLCAYIREFALSHPGLRAAQSEIEPNALALFLPPPSSSSAATAVHPDLVSSGSGREYLHLHEKESSIHMNLSPLDAALAIDRGWACRFPLAGSRGWLGAREPQGRVLIYAPRDEGELEVVKRFVRAGYEYFTVDRKA